MMQVAQFARRAAAVSRMPALSPQAPLLASLGQLPRRHASKKKRRKKRFIMRPTPAYVTKLQGTNIELDADGKKLLALCEQVLTAERAERPPLSPEEQMRESEIERRYTRMIQERRDRMAKFSGHIIKQKHLALYALPEEMKDEVLGEPAEGFRSDFRLPEWFPPHDGFHRDRAEAARMRQLLDHAFMNEDQRSVLKSHADDIATDRQLDLDELIGKDQQEMSG